MRRERGMALASALLVLALAALLAYSLIGQGQISLERSANLQRANQAAELAHGLQDYALVLLAREELEGPGVDSADDAWAAPLPPLPVPQGQVRGSLAELNGRFNLNSLVTKQGGKDPVALRRLQRLLQALELDPRLAAVVVDAVDADQQNDGGAEDLDYLRADPPRRAANRAFAHVSELRSCLGFNDEVLEKLLPHVAALPTGTQLNVNTASVPVLMSLNDDLGSELARRIWNDGRARYTAIGDFVTQLAQAGALLTPEQQADLGVQSNYFLAKAAVSLDGSEYRFQALLERGAGGGRVHWRLRGDFR